MRVRKLKSVSRAFTLIELLITVCIIAILAAIALPSFQKYIHDSQFAEGMMTLGGAYQDQKRVFQETGRYSEVLTDPIVASSVKPLYFRPGGRTKWNMIVGSYQPAEYAGAAMALSDAPLAAGYPNIPPGEPYNTFGVAGEPDDSFGFKADNARMLVGVEADLISNGYRAVMAINERGSMSVLCDDFTQTQDDSLMQQYYAGGYELVCYEATGGSDGGGNVD